MSEANDAAPLVEAQRLRGAALDLVREDVEFLKDALAERPVGTRIKDATVGKLADAAETTKAVAAENKSVVAATGLALAAWFLRGPIVRGAKLAAERLRELRG